MKEKNGSLEMYILDTTTIIELFRGNEKLREILKEKECSVSSISYFEIFSKLYAKRHEKEKRYFLRFFSSAPVYIFDLKSAEESSKIMASLYKIGKPVNIADVMIAGIALANGASGVITRDRDFQEIGKVTDLEIVLF